MSMAKHTDVTRPVSDSLEYTSKRSFKDFSPCMVNQRPVPSCDDRDCERESRSRILRLSIIQIDSSSRLTA
jgi:hypothetical protein